MTIGIIVFVHGSRQGRCITIATATPSGVAVFTTGYANVGSPCVRLRRIALFIGDRGSSQRQGLHRRRSVGEDISDAS